MEYYIVLNGVKEGPFTLEELKLKGVRETTLVWSSGLPDWVQANALPEVMEAIITNPTPQPIPAASQAYSQPAQPRQEAYETQQPVPPMPEDYVQKNIIAAIIGFLCCGLIGAIFAVLGFISGNEVKKLYVLGQYEMAANKAAEAKKWFKISIIVDIVLGILFIIYIFAYTALMATISFFSYLATT